MQKPDLKIEFEAVVGSEEQPGKSKQQMMSSNLGEVDVIGAIPS